MGYRQMGGDTCGLREEVRRKLLDCGALAVGFAKAGPVGSNASEAYDRWLAAGMEAGMGYMHNHSEIRKDPRLLLEGARTIITMAFGYRQPDKRDGSLPRISAYALLPDYHDLIKKQVRKSGIGEILGEEHKDWRLCVDSAPVMERYWAVKSGIAIRGVNGAAIVPEAGSEVFLAEIVTVAEIEPDEAETCDCGNCGACVAACPTGALGSDGMIDCNRCLSYLTIEHRGDWSDSRHAEAMSTKAGRETLFGCDRCISVCPYNRSGKERTTDVEPLDAIRTLTADEILHDETDRLRERLRGSCLKRAKPEGLRRNALNLDDGD